MVAEAERAPSLCKDPLVSSTPLPVPPTCLGKLFFVANRVETHRREPLLWLDSCSLLQKSHGLMSVPESAPPAARFTETNLRILERLLQHRREGDSVIFP